VVIKSGNGSGSLRVRNRKTNHREDQPSEGAGNAKLRSYICRRPVTGILAAQAPEAPPRFEIADVHTSAKNQREFPRPVSVRNGRYELGMRPCWT